MEILQSYLIGPFSEKRDGYVPNWMDSKNPGFPTRALRKKPVSRSTIISENDLEDGKEDRQFDEVITDSNKHTDF